MNIHRLYLDPVSVGLCVEFLCISFFSFILNRLALYFLQSLVFPINLLTVKVKNTLMFITVALYPQAKRLFNGLPSIGLNIFEKRLKLGIDISKKTKTKNFKFSKR